MSLDSVGVMEDGRDQMAMLYVHVFEPVPLLLTVQLIEQGLFEIDPLNIQNHSQALVVALVAKHVEHVSTSVVNVDLLMNHI